MHIFRKIIFSVLFAMGIIFVAVAFASMPPSGFSGHTIVTINDGASLSQVANKLYEANIIRSQFLFKAFVFLVSDSKHIMKGDYLFDQPQSVIRVAYRTAYGVQGLAKIRVTIPEGSNSKNIATIIKEAIPGFDSTKFAVLAQENEGKLFPDTYFFYENVSPEEVVSVMRTNFDKQIAYVKDKIADFGKSIDDILKMASIIEKEATSSTDRRIIAGILWKRIEDKMPLQVDPPFFYFLNKTSDQLTRDDLAKDSPYNLYKHIGLPPTPIDNPGIEAIVDTVSPVTTKYWYYLSDKLGAMHYATTYDGHLANKSRYIQ